MGTILGDSVACKRCPRGDLNPRERGALTCFDERNRRSEAWYGLSEPLLTPAVRDQMGTTYPPFPLTHTKARPRVAYPALHDLSSGGPPGDRLWLTVTPGYPRNMSLTTTQAVSRGIRRGIRMAINPNADHLNELKAKARDQDRMDLAWRRVGQALRASMSTQDSRPSQD